MSADALYAYAVVPDGVAVPPGAPAILPGARHVLIPGGGCAALVSPVPRAPFQPGPAGRLGDTEWLAERARAHRAAIAAVAAQGPVLPLAFGALFPGPRDLIAWLEERGPRLRLALQRGPEEDGTLPEEIAQRLSRRLDREARLMRPTVSALAAEPGVEDVRAELERIRRDLGAPHLAARIGGV